MDVCNLDCPLSPTLLHSLMPPTPYFIRQRSLHCPRRTDRHAQGSDSRMLDIWPSWPLPRAFQHLHAPWDHEARSRGVVMSYVEGGQQSAQDLSRRTRLAMISRKPDPRRTGCGSKTRCTQLGMLSVHSQSPGPSKGERYQAGPREWGRAVGPYVAIPLAPLQCLSYLRLAISHGPSSLVTALRGAFLGVRRRRPFSQR
ncbi:hypothetical protein BS47DRAFT_327496 [Hydnum rufescens UP504]|uniref:Uncharacterized protein n=1 Tax=Hydnum rufescens UP504 TaxID=1448309 RepID=A0A9P6B5P8_9AGAM|nr:hypothetical protein BS47DRAFT_327496 [Hydnum rufescens UP504]